MNIYTYSSGITQWLIRDYSKLTRPPWWQSQWDFKLMSIVKPVCNDYLYYKIYYLWLIQ